MVYKEKVLLCAAIQGKIKTKRHQQYRATVYRSRPLVGIQVTITVSQCKSVRSEKAKKKSWEVIIGQGL